MALYDDLSADYARQAAAMPAGDRGEVFRGGSALPGGMEFVELLVIEGP